ncbi:cytochrome P450 [Nonomuraea angiospora]|uniref:cytochrome P450 n=1 Tax=Nonomuraea angiospora TaxID=46172 RepID=UPI0033FED8F0
MSVIPGPPVRGDGGLHDIATAGGLHAYQLRLHAEYGPVVRFELPGTDSAVSIADPVLLEATAGVNKRPEELFEFLAPLCEAGNLQTLPADEHTPWRRAVLSLLAGRRSHEAHFPGLTALADRLADRWAKQAGEGPVELQKDLSALSLRMICQYALGNGLHDPDKVVTAFEVVLTEYLGRQYQPADPGTEERRRKRAQEALTYLRATVNDVLASGRQDGNTLAPALVTALVAAGMSPARVRDTVLMIMLAAHHTTGVAVSWTLHLLSRHPAEAERVTAEVDEVLSDRVAPEYADLKRLTRLQMALKESMRLYPPGPYGARETTEDLVLAGYEIPTGTTIFYPFWAVHMNPRYWPDPETFNPGRFTPGQVAGRPRYAYIPFGLGPRSCEGASLAMVEAELVLAILLRRLRFQPASGHDVVPVERFVLWAADGIHMNLTPRPATR